MKKNKLIDAIGMINDKYIVEAHKKQKGIYLSLPLISKVLAGGLALFLVVSILPNFFSSAKSDESANSSTYYEYANANEPIEYSSNGKIDSYESSSGNISENIKETNKKLILTASMNMEALDLDEVSNKINATINKYGAYMQSASLSTRNSNRYYEATIRIPADQYSAFLNELKENGNTVSYSESVEDITDRYTDLSIKLESLKAQYTKVLEFYDKAETIDDLMSIEERLSQIEYEIEYCEAQIKNYDLLVAYSTLHLVISESKVYTPVNNNFFYRLKNAIVNGFNNFINSIGDFIIDVVYNIWTIIFLILLVYLAYRIYKYIRKRINK